MTLDTPTDDPSPARQAARRFAQALAWTDLLEATARVEATIHAAGSLADLMELEAGLSAAWPSVAPVCEMLWAGGGSGLEPAAVRLAAFDGAGRLLLRRSYLAGRAGHG